MIARYHRTIRIISKNRLRDDDTNILKSDMNTSMQTVLFVSLIFFGVAFGSYSSVYFYSSADCSGDSIGFDSFFMGCFSENFSFNLAGCNATHLIQAECASSSCETSSCINFTANPLNKCLPAESFQQKGYARIECSSSNNAALTGDYVEVSVSVATPRVLHHVDRLFFLL